VSRIKFQMKFNFKNSTKINQKLVFLIYNTIKEKLMFNLTLQKYFYFPRERRLNFERV
jgi:hypothetical protein